MFNKIKRLYKLFTCKHDFHLKGYGHHAKKKHRLYRLKCEKCGSEDAVDKKTLQSMVRTFGVKYKARS